MLSERHECTKFSLLVAHTHYREPGGEDRVVAAEGELLRRKRHEIEELAFKNCALDALSSHRRLQVAVWNAVAAAKVERVLHDARAELFHIHNTFPYASPSVLHAAKRAGVPVVMTLHNYRLLCVNALLFRNGRVCEECLGRLPWRGVLHGCWRGRPESAVVVAMLALHRAIGTWDIVDRFIALTDFARRKFIEGGLPAEKIVVKPNFVHPDPGPGEGRGGYALFVGRLSAEKGLGTLLRAWERLGGRVPLRIAGVGPLADEVSEAAERVPNIEWLGARAPREVFALMGDAAFLVFPSEWYEGFPRVLVEAYAKGLPVVTTALGSQGAIVEHGRTGLHFRPGDAEDLAAKVEWLLAHPEDLARMRREARAEYEAKYTAERNYEMLMRIYEEAIEAHRRRSRSG